ncbi:MAG: 5-oxoprolinase subunit PxpB [Rhodocyclaceae bacterium]|jgi:KipI family sensor histidine kinase inhibitor|nr:5-oxoprolinase subunit PxpB [Rhodocyclaceae bacterium]
MRLRELGDAALTLELGDSIDRAVHAQVMAAYEALANESLPGVTDLVPTYRSLTVHFDPLIIDRQALIERLTAATTTPSKSVMAGRHVEIPVRFGGESGPDLAEVAKATGRSAEDIVDTLCSLEFTVYLIGFLPGFPYLGDLPDWLRLPRRATPRTAVPPGSVAIAGQQAAVYPWESPGGWHLVGRTEVRMFDAANAERPALLAPGDTVMFVRV